MDKAKIKNTTERYGIVAMTIHWSMAGLILFMLVLGLYMTSLPDGDEKWGWYSLHKSFGVVVAILLLGRIVWRHINQAPLLPAGLNEVEKILAKLVHLALYALPILLIVSGYVDSSAGGYKFTFFDWFEIPKLLDKDESLEKLSLTIHQWSAYLLIFSLFLHFGAVLKHHLILKDDVLKRMLP